MKVLIQVQGGLVQAVYVDNQEVEVIIQDFDVYEEPSEDNGVIELDNGELCTAYIDKGILNADLVENIYNAAK